MKPDTAGHLKDFLRDTLFGFIFSDKENALSLYNALNNSDYDNPDDLEITTLDDVIFMKQKNDISFLIGDTLQFKTHQTSASRVRCLL